MRCREVKDLLTTKNPNPYPHKFTSTLIPADFHAKYQHLKSGEAVKEDKIELGARIITMRASSAKLRFYDVKSGRLTGLARFFNTN
jgi:lysyl-tRNA synthetase class 2